MISRKLAGTILWVLGLVVAEDVVFSVLVAWMKLVSSWMKQVF